MKLKDFVRKLSLYFRIAKKDNERPVVVEFHSADNKIVQHSVKDVYCRTIKGTTKVVILVQESEVPADDSCVACIINEG
jgi:16S rRNA C1402 N4-methylase RsmH